MCLKSTTRVMAVGVKFARHEGCHLALSIVLQKLIATALDIPKSNVAIPEAASLFTVHRRRMSLVVIVPQARAFLVGNSTASHVRLRVTGILLLHCHTPPLVGTVCTARATLLRAFAALL